MYVYIGSGCRDRNYFNHYHYVYVVLCLICECVGFSYCVFQTNIERRMDRPKAVVGVIRGVA